MKRFVYLFILVTTVVFSQENPNTTTIEASLFGGNVLPHRPDLYHLQGHAQAFLTAYNVKTHGRKEWQSAYNFPDYGGYFLYQDFGNPFLGENISVGAHMNFYFLKRNLQFHFGNGIAYANKPYDKVTNSKNKAFGSHYLANINLGLYYQKDFLLGKLGFKAGLLFMHYSNGRTKSPNSGINTYGLNVGLNYNFSDKVANVQQDTTAQKKYAEKLHYNLVFRTGVNESPLINSGQKPFYHIGAFVDKRITRKSSLELGADFFLTQSNKEFIKYKAMAYPELHLNGNADYKRIGLFVGYEMHITKLSFEAQLGYYVYDQFKNDLSLYDRFGLKYHFTKNLYATAQVKTHLFSAEAIEYGIGARF